jgi:hypothetical protein
MKSRKSIITDDKASTAALLWMITKMYGSECYSWEPTVLKAELQIDLDCEISDLQSDKIQAGITLLSTDLYETNIKVFETINYLFNNQHDELDELSPLEAEELICGLTEAYVIRAEELHFSPEVRVYAGQIFYDYGMHKAPKIFPMAIMKESEGDDSSKNDALEEIFNAKIQGIEKYMKQCTR